MIKALGGLNAEQSAKNQENASNINGNSPAKPNASDATKTDLPTQKSERPNLMAEAILRHEQIANRLKRK